MGERDKVFLRTEAMSDQVWARAHDELGDIQRIAFAMMRDRPTGDDAVVCRALMLVVGELYRRSSLTHE